VGQATSESTLEFWMGKEIFLFSRVSGQALGPTQLHIQGILGVISKR
jgi:hypothetical protein